MWLKMRVDPAPRLCLSAWVCGIGSDSVGWSEPDTSHCATSANAPRLEHGLLNTFVDGIGCAVASCLDHSFARCASSATRMKLRPVRPRNCSCACDSSSEVGSQSASSNGKPTLGVEHVGPGSRKASQHVLEGRESGSWRRRNIWTAMEVLPRRARLHIHQRRLLPKLSLNAFGHGRHCDQPVGT